MRNHSLSVIERNGSILARIRRIKEEHPSWGYRRVWAWLRYKERVLVNKKRVLRLMQVSGLTLKPNERLRAKRLPERPKPRPTRPRKWWGIYMDEGPYPFGLGLYRLGPGLVHEKDRGPSCGLKGSLQRLAGSHG